MAQLGREEHSGGERERLSLLYLSASNKYTKHNRTDACVIFVMQRCQLPVFRSSTTTANLNNSASLNTHQTFLANQRKQRQKKIFIYQILKGETSGTKRKIVWCWRRRRAKVGKRRERETASCTVTRSLELSKTL